jgi:hypothetical protein
VPETRQKFLDDVRSYTAAGERLVAVLTEFNAMNTEAVEDIEAGMSVAESFELRDSATWSRKVSSLLEEFEACRRATRASAAAALLTEGRTVTDVGKAFGVSHQLASRFARGARGADEGAGGDRGDRGDSGDDPLAAAPDQQTG